MRLRTSLALLAGPVLMAQLTHGSFEKNLEALKCHSVLLFKSEEIRDPIHWSLDGKAIGVKVAGRWVRIDLDGLILKRFKWRNDLDIAAPTTLPVMKDLPDDVRKSWLPAIEDDSRRVRTRTGTILELEPLDKGGVSFRITPSDGRTREIWRTSIEDCQGFVLSPDHRWVAYICGKHGVVLTKLP